MGDPEMGERERRHFEIERELADRLRAASKSERRTLYTEIYDELFRRVELPGNEEAQQAQVGLLLELLRPFIGPGTTLLEIGAGRCDLSLAAADRVERVWAVDAVDPGLDPATSPPNFGFVPASELADRVAGGSVDVAVSCHFVEHLHPDDLTDHLRQVVDLLVDGGCYIVVTPNRIYGPHDISRGFSDRAVGLHLREYTHGDLARELGRAGFAEIGVIGAPGSAPRFGRLGMIATVETVVDRLPGPLRRLAASMAPRRAPFRPLEQVKLVAHRRRRVGARR
jgi:SAM-dependent methyltransferase